MQPTVSYSQGAKFKKGKFFTINPLVVLGLILFALDSICISGPDPDAFSIITENRPWSLNKMVSQIRLRIDESLIPV